METETENLIGSLVKINSNVKRLERLILTLLSSRDGCVGV